MSFDILLVLDTIEDRLVRQSLELLGFATARDRFDSSRTLLLLPGKNMATVAGELARKYGLTTVACEHDQLYYPNPALMGTLLVETINEFRPELVCFLHTPRNCQCASALAVALGTASITAVESMTADSGGPLFRRSVAGGKLVQSVRSSAPCTIITVLAGAFSQIRPLAGGASPPALLRRSPLIRERDYLPTGIDRINDSFPDPGDADVVIAAGRGIGSEQHLAIIKEVSRIFANAAIGASRPLCDQRWLHSSHQVGVTGRTIAPRLYMACGISGAQQHLAGIRGADCIVAINSDPDAAIFAVADYIVIDDLNAFLPAMLLKYREKFTMNESGVTP